MRDYHWRLGDATGLGRPEGLRTASCDAGREAHSVEWPAPSSAAPRRSCPAPGSPAASGGGGAATGARHVLPGSERTCARQVLLLGPVPGPPSALICGDNPNVGKRGSQEQGGRPAASPPLHTPSLGEAGAVFKLCFRNLPWDTGTLRGWGLGHLLAEQLFLLFSDPGLCRNEEPQLPSVVCQTR